MINIEKYHIGIKDDWNKLVKSSRNGTFILLRDYLEYHADRFNDFSLVARKNGALIAVMPANMVENTLYSHQGLTYGGWIVSDDVNIEDTLDLMLQLCLFLEPLQINAVVYKPVPLYFQRFPFQDDLFALSLLKAEIFRLDTSYIIDYSFPFNFQSRRIRNVKKAIKSGVKLNFNCPLDQFWNHVLIPNLEEKYGTKPVHSLEEITLLKNRFPEQIWQCNASIDEEIVAGATIYAGDTYAHTQYISSTGKGRDSGALDLLFHWMITEIFNKKKYFSFGTANNSGNDLNHGVAEWKSGWGAYTSPHLYFRFNTNQTEGLIQTVRH